MRIVAILLGLGAAACVRESAGPVAPPPSYVAPPNTTAAALPPYTGAYRLPFDGRWKVARTHYDLSNDQALAVDVILDVPVPAQTAANPNNAFPSWGRPILADGPGVVAIAVDGNPENIVGTPNSYEAHGNFVVIDHKNGDFSLFAHFVPGSLRVHAGEVVGMGQVLGLCGNSGHSTMPHLHYQIMDSAYADRAHARAIRHLDYLRNGARSVHRMEAGDTVEPLP